MVHEGQVKILDLGLARLAEMNAITLTGQPWGLLALRVLNACGNRLADLPELPELRELNLRENGLEKLPEALASRPHLRSLDLRGNSSSTCPS